ncbi:hypothetical protein VT91_24080 [Clostridium sporogenes]|nr:hypothetical protein WG71_25190 [Clostridium sporogenes]KRU28149.1 hypothetical protein VT91_24080 [Clostridium sporogenes]KRU29065.1 hypothetical protein VT28_20320 [Clostridium sporogenes]KRU39854.1 hypothetical protein VT95_28210 [Clostridium sporogenes]OQP97000.1 hypothetical protein VT92_0227720 [Clostridium sporogenes]
MKHIAREKFPLNMIKKCLGSSDEIWRNYPGYLLKYNPNVK